MMIYRALGGNETEINRFNTVFPIRNLLDFQVVGTARLRRSRRHVGCDSRDRLANSARYYAGGTSKHGVPTNSN